MAWKSADIYECDEVLASKEAAYEIHYEVVMHIYGVSHDEAKQFTMEYDEDSENIFVYHYAVDGGTKSIILSFVESLTKQGGRISLEQT